MRELVAIDLDGGPAFVDALARIFDDGDVALPLDRRLPAPARRALLQQARPHAVVMGPAADPRTATTGLTHPPRRVRHQADAPLMAEGDALVVASSGSTGTAKLLVHTHQGLRAHARAVHRRLAVDQGHDRWLACLPLNHLGGLGVVLRALYEDIGLDVWPRADARLGAAPADLGSTLVSLVPTMLDRTDASGFRRVVLGGTADPTDRPANVTRTYGLTETAGGVIYDGWALDGIEVRIDDRGSIALRGPTTARGRRAGDGAVDPVTGPDGWMETGDVGWWADDGRLQVAGRADDLIITGGENVWPGPVESVLGRHPQVAEVVVIGRPDPQWGQRVVAVIVAADPEQPPTVGSLREWARAWLPASALPRHLVVVDALPRTSLGKVRRQALDRLAATAPLTLEPEDRGTETGEPKPVSGYGLAM